MVFRWPLTANTYRTSLFIADSHHIRATLPRNVANCTDFNGDGIGDIVVGAPGANNGVGEAHIIYGNASGFEADLDLSALAEREHAGLVLSGSEGGIFSHSIGYAVAAAG